MADEETIARGVEEGLRRDRIYQSKASCFGLIVVLVSLFACSGIWTVTQNLAIAVSVGVVLAIAGLWFVAQRL